MWLPEFLRDSRVPTNVMHLAIGKSLLRMCKSSCGRALQNVTRCQITQVLKTTLRIHKNCWGAFALNGRILAEGAIALSVTHSGGALFASWKLLQFPSSLIVKVILAIFMGASAQQHWLTAWHWKSCIHKGSPWSSQARTQINRSTHKHMHLLMSAPALGPHNICKNDFHGQTWRELE